MSCAKRIYAKVLNIEANNDGKIKRSFLSTSEQGQIKLYEKNMRISNLTPNDIEYVEAHGAGIGDNIEIKALAETYGKYRFRPLLVGSVKTNLGHTEATSGFCALAKVITIFQTNIIPASLYYNKSKLEIYSIIPNIIMPVMENSKYNGGVVAINMFGLGGTNVQILLSS